MGDYGVTDKGFVIKRLDVIMDEVHSKLSEGFGFNTRLDSQSFLNVLIATFCGQVSEAWEVAQDSYYAKYPSTAEGVNLDNAVQYGGIRRSPNKYSYYKLHCTGDDGTAVKAGTTIATDTLPQKRLTAVADFELTRESFNRVRIKVAAVEDNAVYSISVNGIQYSFSNSGGGEADILEGLTKVTVPDGYTVSYDAEAGYISIVDDTPTRSGMLVLSDNLTTVSVTTLADFATTEYGKLIFPNGTVSVIVTNVTGFSSVENLISPTYGRLQETDTELRHSYIAKSAIRSNRMLDSICAKLINDVDNVESATGYENDTDATDSEGRPPHSIEIVVDGGDAADIAEAILDKKAAGIQTYGSECYVVATSYGDQIPIRFNRPEYIYVWMKIKLTADDAGLPSGYANTVIESITEDLSGISAGEDLLCQELLDGIYNTVAGIRYVDIKCAITTDSSYIPESAEYVHLNVEATSRQKVMVSGTRIEVMLDGGS